MGMLIDGKWEATADRSMVSGTYRREQSALPTSIDAKFLKESGSKKGRFFLIASASCPWSHGAVIALVLANLRDSIEIQWAGGPRREGYGLLSGGHSRTVLIFNMFISFILQRFLTTRVAQQYQSFGTQ